MTNSGPELQCASYSQVWLKGFILYRRVPLVLFCVLQSESCCRCLSVFNFAIPKLLYPSFIYQNFHSCVSIALPFHLSASLVTHHFRSAYLSFALPSPDLPPQRPDCPAPAEFAGSGGHCSAPYIPGAPSDSISQRSPTVLASRDRPGFPGGLPLRLCSRRLSVSEGSVTDLLFLVMGF